MGQTMVQTVRHDDLGSGNRQPFEKGLPITNPATALTQYQSAAVGGESKVVGLPRLMQERRGDEDTTSNLRQAVGQQAGFFGAGHGAAETISGRRGILCRLRGAGHVTVKTRPVPEDGIDQMLQWTLHLPPEHRGRSDDFPVI